MKRSEHDENPTQPSRSLAIANRRQQVKFLGLLLVFLTAAVPGFAQEPVGTSSTQSSTATTSEPHFSPAPGKLPGDTQVKLASHTPGAIIHYTVDGSQPTLTSPVCHAPIAVIGTALTIKAFATSPGRRDSPVVTGNFHIGED